MCRNGGWTLQFVPSSSLRMSTQDCLDSRKSWAARSIALFWAPCESVRTCVRTPLIHRPNYREWTENLKEWALDTALDTVSPDGGRKGLQLPSTPERPYDRAS